MFEDEFSSTPASGIADEAAPEAATPAVEPVVVPVKPPFWNGWDAWVLLGVAIAGSLFSSLVCQLGYLLLRDLLHWPVKGSGELANNPYFILAVQLVLYVLLVAFLYFLITRKYSLNFNRSLGLIKLPQSSVGQFALLGLVLAVLVMALSSLFPSARETPLEKIFGQGRAIYFFAVFGIFVAPFTEELIFRGFLYPIFENLKGRLFAVLTTALIFAALHVPQLWGSWSAVGLIFFVGLILSLVRSVTGRLTPSWIIHAAYNSTLVLAVVVARVLSPLAHSFR